MPSRRCQHPTCTAYIPADQPGRHCALHGPEVRKSKARAAQFYDQHHRNRAAKDFYNSREWKDARADVLADHPTCQECIRRPAAHVHHIVPLAECAPAQRTSRDNLLALCQPCHNAIEANAAALRRPA